MPFCKPLLAGSLLLLLVGPHLHADVSTANQALQQGQVERAASLLRPWLSDHPADSQAHLTLCRVFYAQELVNGAVMECEAAAMGSSNTSEVQLWLGRAYGMKASSANPLVAFSTARKVRDAFELAVRLDPSNLVAMSDLGEFYVEAPAIVGGGLDKARQLAGRLRSVNTPASTAQSHRILGLIAEKGKDFSKAETEYRQASVGNLPGAWIDLGGFYARRHQFDLAEAAVQSAAKLDPGRDAILVDAASVLTEAHRSLELARQLLSAYIASPNTSDAAPVFKVHLQLGELLTQAGDTASARKELELAARMAPNFPAARKAQPHPSQSGRQ